MTYSTEECRKRQTTVSGECKELSRSRRDLIDGSEEQQNTNNGSETRRTSFGSNSVVEDLQISLVRLASNILRCTYLNVPLTELGIENRLYRTSQGKHKRDDGDKAQSVVDDCSSSHRSWKNP